MTRVFEIKFNNTSIYKTPNEGKQTIDGERGEIVITRMTLNYASK
jgi:phenylacetate-coenzyme A ligase PaaK-like adenylate-forming protein